MQVILDVVLPVFGLILAGFLAGKFKVLGQGSTEALNSFVYYFALPPLLFIGMARVPVAQVFNLPFLIAFMGGIVLTAGITVLIARVVFPGRPSETAFAGFLGSYSNSGYMGIPLFMTAYGPEGMLPVIIASVINSAVMVGAIVAAIEAELKGAAGARAAIVHAGRALVTNPLVIAPLLGLLWSALSIPLPKPVTTFCDLLGAAAGPGALFAIGLFLASQSLGNLVGGRKAAEVGFLIVIKLLVYPAITWVLATAVGLEGYWFAATVVLAALPAGAVSFVVASNYGIYVARTSATILASTVLSVVTLSVLMVLFAGVRP